MGRPREIALDTAMILRAAFDLLEEAGLDGLTMRGVAARLAIQAPALYYHMEDKAELLARMSQDILTHAQAEIGETASAEQWLTEFGTIFSRKLKEYRDSARLFATAGYHRQIGSEYAEKMAAPLIAHGFSLKASLEAQTAVIALTLGFAFIVQNQKMAAYLGTLFDLADSHARGLRQLISGVADEARRESEMADLRNAVLE